MAPDFGGLRGEAELLNQRFLEICSHRDDVTIKDGRIVLNVTQAAHSGHFIDTVDRIVLGAEFVRTLIGAGL